MIKKFILIGSVFASTIFADTELPNDMMAQKILKNVYDNKGMVGTAALDPSKPPKEDNLNSNAEKLGDFNVVGTATINDSKYCYVINEQNKIIKATIGMTVKGKKITDITDYGITVNDKSNNTSFYPIVVNQIEESDITFFNKDKKSQNHN